jgi:membrane protein insertase Oxa1/YidC/SpoIIIJ
MPPTEHQSWLLVLSDAVYRRLLVCYPKAFRAAYGAEMAQVFRDRAREVYRGRGAAGLLALWVAALRDLVAAAVAERLVEERQMVRKVVTVATVLIVVGIVVGVILLAIVQESFRYRLLDFIFRPVYLVYSVAFRPVFNLLIVIYGLVHNFPLAFVLVTVVLQLCLLPLTHRLLRDARTLRTIKPELRQLGEQYRDDPAAWQAARRDLYRAHGILPGGVALWLSLWLFLQYDLLFILSSALREVLPRFGAGDAVTQVQEAQAQVAHINFSLYPFVPHLQQLPEMGFLWTNLVTADRLYILPVLAMLLTLFVVYLLRRRSLGGVPAPLRLVSSLVGSAGQLVVLLLALTFVLWSSAGVELLWGVSMLVTVAGYVALVRRTPGGEGPRDHRLAAGSAE